MTTMIRTLSALAFAVGVSALISGAAFAQEAMSTDAMTPEAMKADCMAKAEAETDSAMKASMTAECETAAMGTDAMAPADAMKTDDAMAPAQ